MTGASRKVALLGADDLDIPAPGVGARGTNYGVVAARMLFDDEG